jgi:hypothetical protein
VSEPYEDPGWRIRAGAGLLVHSPISDEWRERQRREDQREVAQATLEAEIQAQSVLEHRAELERRGVTATSVQDRLAAVAAADQREQRKHEKRLAMGLLPASNDYWGSDAAVDDPAPPQPRLDRWEVKQAVAEREAAAENTAATKADLGRLEQVVTQLGGALSMLKRRRP